MTKIKDYEGFIGWFESVYRNKPIEIDLREKDGSYRCTIVYFRKTNPKDLIEVDKFRKYYFEKN